MEIVPKLKVFSSPLRSIIVVRGMSKHRVKPVQ